MSFSKNFVRMVSVAVLFVGFTGYSFIKADQYGQSDWFPPENGSAGPQNNVAAPLNTGSSTQTKIGSLAIGNTLGLFGDKPLVAFINSDTEIPRWVTSAVVETPGIPTMKFLYDRDNNGSVWNNSNAILELHAGVTVNDDYAQFSNEIWAGKYCDRNGDNCVDPADPVIPETDLSAIHTYSTPNNIRSVSGAACSCNDGDFLTSCNANGQPMISSDANSCSGSAVMCTCLATKPSPRLCAVTISGYIYNYGYHEREAINLSKSVTIQVSEGSLMGVGMWTDSEFGYRDGKFTGGDLLAANQTHQNTARQSHTALGYWSPTDYKTAGPAFVNYFITNGQPWSGWYWLTGRRTGFIVKEGMKPQIAATPDNTLRYDSGFGSGTRYIFEHRGRVTATIGLCQ